jgi:hypothetical protein
MRCFALVFVLACGGSPPPAQPKVGCDSPEPGQAMTREQCACRDGRITLAKGGAVELHCEAGEVELGTVRLGLEGGWCCKAQ